VTDKVTPEERSRMMRAVRRTDTKPEVFVRHALHANGFRFRLHRADLPGKPDIVLPKFRMAIFIHGCFWHGHDCRRGKRPDTRKEFWNKKIDSNMERDRRACTALTEFGWSAVTIWTCELREKTEHLISDLRRRAIKQISSSPGTRHRRRRV
jgi:DNA mismatch endonuclease, patch repair protein